MIFTSLEFILFFALLLFLIYSIRNQKAKKYILLLSSYFFYGYWDYRFLSLIIFSTVLNYCIGYQFAKNNNKITRDLYLIFSVFCNLGLLAYFKYFNFFIATFVSAFNVEVGTLNIILPVGISFYTFQAMSYTIDVYRRKITHTRSVLEFAIFVAFFPQLVAGPIVRAIDFLPQIKKDITLTSGNLSKGLQIFIYGAIKKVLIADRLAYFVDVIFQSPDIYSSTSLWIGIIAYSIQVYCDFSGYSDMAVGVANIMGFKLLKNFDVPYISTNPTEFWRRWHISLSSWLKDYLYVSLGGNRKGKLRQYVNIIVTMLLGGLWHGASLTFTAWGLLHGLALVIHKQYGEIKKDMHAYSGFFSTKAYMFVSWFATYVFVISCWVLFRAQNFSDAFLILRKMYTFEAGIHYLFTPMVIIIPVIVCAHAYKIKYKLTEYILFDLTTYKGLLILLFAIFTIFYFAPSNPSPFIYFQF
jgi:alginate O-acetyltransferase complex protein AlgI